MTGPQLEPAVDHFDYVHMNQVSIPSMIYVATLKKRINIIETQMRTSIQDLQGRIKDLKQMVLNLTKTLVSSLQSLSMDSLIGLSTWSASTGWAQPRNRTASTHHDVLA
jgi:hypothetical protein